jgi:hypothetical protein
MTRAGYAIWKEALAPVLKAPAGSSRLPMLDQEAGDSGPWLLPDRD